jgi:soluble lytic murein transglycosylase-like protein
VEHFMRACVIAAAIVALTQPAFAAKTHKKSSHRHHVSHLSHQHLAQHHRRHVRVRSIEPGAAQTFARTDATDRPFFSDPSFPNRSAQVSATPAPRFAQFGEPATAQSFEAAPRARVARGNNGALDSMIARHAAANGVPVELVHRVVKRESGYNPRASSRGNIGLMQIRAATARGIGYSGSAAGLLDPETNLTYAVKYLAGAYRAAGGNASRAVSLYASGYHGRGVRVARR